MAYSQKSSPGCCASKGAAEAAPLPGSEKNRQLDLISAVG